MWITWRRKLVGENEIVVAAEKITELVIGVVGATGEVNSEAAAETVERLRKSFSFSRGVPPKSDFNFL
ncbi:unnamed protein product [Linum trigynum]|uniref:Uncharacterized protein n=1 Tax=Linum trigynum TaxID=586398 RepID=A0AAV2DPV6_9ROSI